MSGNRAQALADVHPKPLRELEEERHKNLGFAEKQALFRSQHGQAFEWALEKSHINDKTAAAACQYTNQAVISNWKTGKERHQLDTLRAGLGESFFAEFLLTLLETCEGAEVFTDVRLRRRRSA